MRRQWQRWAVLVLCVSSLSVLVPAARAADKDEDYYELMKVFVDTFEQIERNYVKDVDRRELMEAAIQGMLGKLDQYSSYISPDELKRFTRIVDQEFGGIGIQVDGPPNPRVPRLTVMSPLPGTPAYKAGLKAGDVIMEIEGESTDGLAVSDAVKVLTGKPGEAVTIGVRNADSKEIKQVTIVRELIQVATVQGDRYQDDGRWDFFLDNEHKIGYVRLTHFSRRSADELRATFEQLIDDGMKGLVLDLRFNPGGLLSQATEISDMLIEAGRIVSTKGRNTPERTWEAKADGTFSGFPMAVLVNGFSASASEIVSACLQDHKRAVIVGQRTWGKGSVQNVIELEEGSSALKLTTASYHRPSGKNIHRFHGAKESDVWGVSPDEGFEVKFKFDEMRKYQEYRQERDILQDGGPPKSEFDDRQLARAVKYVLEQLDAPAKAKKPTADDKKNEPPTETKKAAALPAHAIPSAGSRRT
jgi:carboxyl-terminal processing protease